MSRYVAQIIPFLSLGFSLFLTCYSLKVDLRRYTLFFILTGVFSVFLVAPVLCIPFFGFLPYFVVIKGSQAIYWIYLYHAERSSSVATLLIMLSATIFTIQYSLGSFVFSRILKLPFKTCVTVFFCTLFSAVLMTICFGMVFFG